MKTSALPIFLTLAASMGLSNDVLAVRKAKRDEKSRQEMLEEYELIQQKKSRLSANQRRRIVEYVETRLSR